MVFYDGWTLRANFNGLFSSAWYLLPPRKNIVELVMKWKELSAAADEQQPSLDHSESQ